MTFRPISYRAGVVTLVLIATLVVIQPLGIFRHFVTDHLLEHSMSVRNGVVLQLGDADAPDHDADHCHVWTTPAVAAVTPRVRQPQSIAAVALFEDVPLPSAPPFPPLPPPRA